LKPWIDYCTTQRASAKSDFESDLAKLKANSTFGKCLESVRHRQNIRLIADSAKALKAVSKPTFRTSEIINADLVMVKGARQCITLNKPISAGFAILEISKLIMYEFYYDYLKPKYADRCKLLFSDTDSVCCSINTHDIHQDMKLDLDKFDTSNFEREHEIYSADNRRVLGKMKSETGSAHIKEFIGLKPKMYSLYVPDISKITPKVKGVKKSFVKKNLSHAMFVDALTNRQTTSSNFHTFRSSNHQIETVHVFKKCLDVFDDKRFILENGVDTLAYGHKDCC
jgi:hypothetical protein